MAQKTPLLEAQNITKSFPGVKALDNVSLKVFPAEVVALIGENGAGKSTLMNLIGGILQPDSGTISVNGKAVIIRNVSEAINLGIGFIHQELNVLDNLSIAANVFLGREPLWAGPLKLVNRNLINDRTEPHLERLGLDRSPDTLVKDLSIAQQQIVEIAKALSLNARLIIMDEPTSSLTISETKRLFKVVRQLRSEGVSIIYISHRLAEVKECADRVVVFRDGKNAGSLAREEINHDNMVRMMIGRDLEDFFIPPTDKPRKGRFCVTGLRTNTYPDREITFEALRGEILGFAGLIGAGRSEMAQAIFGVEKSLAGTVTLDDKNFQINSAKDAIRNGVYLVPEDRRKSGLVVDMSFRENVTMPRLNKYATASIISKKREVAAAKKQSQSLAIKITSIEMPVGNLSGGNQQKVVLAKWLAIDPKVIIFDEPTRGIDVGSKSEIYHLMRSLSERGVIVIMISSDMEEILGVSDRIAVMHEGTITGILDRSEADEETVMRLAVGTKLERQTG